MNSSTTNADELRQAIGRSREENERLAVMPPRRLAATFDRGAEGLDEGDLLPPGWHWLYFLEVPPSGVLGDDGRTYEGGLLPDPGLPRRMWAGGSFAFHGGLRLGEEAHCLTRIAEIAPKQGRSGPLVFITTEHLVSQNGIVAVEERRNLVFRAPAQPGETSRREEAPGKAVWRREIQPDPVLLFRFSALTFNAHRIHYDVDYCRDEEGYPGLVVHGPMLALLLLDLVAREMPDARIARFDYRAAAPLFAGSPFQVCGRPGDGNVELWAESADGTLATLATATLA